MLFPLEHVEDIYVQLKGLKQELNTLAEAIIHAVLITPLVILVGHMCRTSNQLGSVEKLNVLSLKKKFRQINYLVIPLVNPLLSRNFCQKCVIENSGKFHRVRILFCFFLFLCG